MTIYSQKVYSELKKFYVLCKIKRIINIYFVSCQHNISATELLLSKLVLKFDPAEFLKILGNSELVSF